MASSLPITVLLILLLKTGNKLGKRLAHWLWMKGRTGRKVEIISGKFMHQTIVFSFPFASFPIRRLKLSNNNTEDGYDWENWRNFCEQSIQILKNTKLFVRTKFHNIYSLLLINSFPSIFLRSRHAFLLFRLQLNWILF